jgi:5-methylcytosine-specific restriction endonuclease McrA
MAWGGSRAIAKRRQVLEVYGNVCWLCGQPVPGLPSADHVIPRSRGGSDDIENLRPCHTRCNSSRGNRLPRRRPTPLATPTDW